MYFALPKTVFHGVKTREAVPDFGCECLSSWSASHQRAPLVVDDGFMKKRWLAYTRQSTNTPIPSSVPTHLSASARTSSTRVNFTRVPARRIANPPSPQTTRVSLTSLLVSGHCKMQAFNPETTVGRVKELVCNAYLARHAGSSVVSVCPPRHGRLLIAGVRPALGSILLTALFPVPSHPRLAR